jgi:hypothetical protein
MLDISLVGKLIGLGGGWIGLGGGWIGLSLILVLLLVLGYF